MKQYDNKQEQLVMGLDILAFSPAVDKLSVDNMVDYEENMLCIMLQYFMYTFVKPAWPLLRE